LDGGGAAYSANLLGSHPSLRNILFTLGPPNANNVIRCGGQTIPLPPGQYTSVQMLATAINGNQNNQALTVTYADNSTALFSQSISDWFTPQKNSAESTIVSMPYRDNSNGTKDSRTFNLYDYSFTLDKTKTVKSISLPNNGNVMV